MMNDVHSSGVSAPPRPRKSADLVARAIAPLTLRLALGRRPESSEILAFRTGFATRDLHLPALTRALIGVPAVRSLIEAGLYNPRATGLPKTSLLEGDYQMVWTGQPLSFLHLEKCGGNAVMVWLASQFHPTQIDPDPSRAIPPHMLYRAPPGLATDVAQYKLLWGHFGLPALERIGPGRFTFTLLREPRARLVSCYRFWRSVHPHLVGDIATDPIIGSAHRNDLLGFLRDPEPMLRDQIDNMYVRRLTGRYVTGAVTDPVAADPAASLAQARAAIGRLGFVGITERLDQSVTRLAHLIGAEPPAGSMRENVGAENHLVSPHFFRAIETDPVTPEAQAELDRLTTLDRQLYAEALAWFESTRRAPALI